MAATAATAANAAATAATAATAANVAATAATVAICSLGITPTRTTTCPGAIGDASRSISSRAPLRCARACVGGGDRNAPPLSHPRERRLLLLRRQKVQMLRGQPQK
eukprot:4053774-Pleurochrysis_carterae.AAC.1